MAPLLLFLVYSILPYLGKSNKSMQTKPFMSNEEVYLPWDMPKTSKASYASTLIPPQKGHQNK